MDPVLFHFRRRSNDHPVCLGITGWQSRYGKIKKKIGVDMEDAIFSGVQLLFPDVSKLYCVCHMKQRDDIFFLAKSKCSENEKAFKAKYYWLEKIERILQN